MGNADIHQNLNRLQDRINEFYTDGKQSDDKKAAADMWINDKNVVVKKDENVTPGSHLENAQYIDVIERDGSTQQKIRFLFIFNESNFAKRLKFFFFLNIDFV